MHKGSLHYDYDTPIKHSEYILIFFAITYFKIMQSSELELNLH